MKPAYPTQLSPLIHSSKTATRLWTGSFCYLKDDCRISITSSQSKFPPREPFPSRTPPPCRATSIEYTCFTKPAHLFDNNLPVNRGCHEKGRYCSRDHCRSADSSGGNGM